jgi:hypothetical protein
MSLVFRSSVDPLVEDSAKRRFDRPVVIDENVTEAC